MEDNFKIAAQCFEEFCSNNAVKPTNMKADYYISGFLRGQKHEQEQVRPLAWVSPKDRLPEVGTWCVLIMDGKYVRVGKYVGKMRCMGRWEIIIGNTEYDYHERFINYWMPVPEFPTELRII